MRGFVSTGAGAFGAGVLSILLITISTYVRPAFAASVALGDGDLAPLATADRLSDVSPLTAPPPSPAQTSTPAAVPQVQPAREWLAPPERIFLQALAQLARGDEDAARSLGQELLSARPDFALARALTDDLDALAHNQPPRIDWQAVTSDLPGTTHEVVPAEVLGLAPAPYAPEVVPALAAEAAQRWRHRHFRPDGSLPDLLVQLSPAVRHVVVVETASSRLYLFRQRQGELTLEADYYVSIGRAGAGKRSDGDLRTPLGVYFTLSRMDDTTLADRYGEHAFPLNYPNRWDRHLGRTGRGIWLHGVPHDTYSRPPRDSEGCVALTNEDIARLARRLDPRFTPVLITEQIYWVAPEVRNRHLPTLLTRVRQWISEAHATTGNLAGTAGQSGEAQVPPVARRHQALARFYESPAPVRGSRYQASAEGRGEEIGELPAPLAPEAAGASGATATATALRDAIIPGLSATDINVFAYPGEPDLMLVTFDEPAADADGGRAGWRRQYWRRAADGAWRIVAERAGVHRRRR